MQQRGTIKAIIAAAIVAVAAACHNGRGTDALLTSADSLLRAGAADSAMSLLDSMEARLPSFSRAAHMRFRLLQADAMNKTYRDFTTDSVMRKVADYYDHHGTPNERLRAYYLLGCTYRDLHEAPIALITWEDAIDKADTLSPDCDYATLFRIYGQMAGIYFRQYMPEKELDAQEKFNKYALLAGDTLNYIRGLLLRNDAYLALHDTAAVLKNIDNVRLLYLQRGLTQEAAQVYPSAIQIALNRKDYAKADSMMQIFEKESGLFDEQGNIAPTRENYYFEKGRYYVGMDELDSAEFMFRRLLPYPEHHAIAYHGLMFLFQYKHQTDSVLKYVMLYNNALADYLNNTNTEAIVRTQGMYDYHRQMKIANDKEHLASRWKLGGLAATLIAGIIVFILYIFYNRANETRKRQELELIHLTRSYSQAIEHLNKAQEESQMLKSSLSDREALERLSDEKAEQVFQLETIVADLHLQIDELKRSLTKNSSQESEVIGHFQSIAKCRSCRGDNGTITFEAGKHATDEEWTMMYTMIRECHPAFYLFLRERQLKEIQFRVCILSRYGFNNEEIATLTELETKSVSNVRTKVAKEVFGLSSAYDLNKYLIEIQ